MLNEPYFISTSERILLVQDAVSPLSPLHLQAAELYVTPANVFLIFLLWVMMTARTVSGFSLCEKQQKHFARQLYTTLSSRNRITFAKKTKRITFPNPCAGSHIDCVKIIYIDKNDINCMIHHKY